MYCRWPDIACAAVKLNASRSVTGVLRGYDQFMNVVLDHTQGLPIEVVVSDRAGIGVIACRREMGLP